MACEDYFRAALKERGLRLTKQRQLVLATLHAAAKPVTAEEIHQIVSVEDPGMDLSTIYRTLGLMQELRLVAGFDGSAGESRFELVSLHGPHLHLHCQACGHVQGAAAGEADELVKRLRRKYGFEVQIEQLVIPGLCQTCRACGQAPSPPWVGATD